METELKKIKPDLIKALMTEIKKETKKINDNINDKLEKKLESVENKLAEVEVKLVSVEKTALNAWNQTEVNKQDIVQTNLTIEEHKQDILQTSKLLEEHKQEIISLKASLNEQVDHSLRYTLVFKGIPKEKKENSWDDAKNSLKNYLSATFNWNKNELNKDIERAHRGKTTDANNLRKIRILESLGINQKRSNKSKPRWSYKCNCDTNVLKRNHRYI